MNPNGPHQIPLNPALMNTLMASLQSQPQMQTFGASGAGADPVFMLANFQQQQQRPGLQGAPNFFLHGFQPQNMAGPSMPGGQQWILPQSQPPTTVPPAPQASFKGQSAHRQPSADAAKLAERQRDQDSTPLGSDPDDEEMLINTLKKAQARGISPRKALNKLHLVGFTANIKFGIQLIPAGL